MIVADRGARAVACRAFPLQPNCDFMPAIRARRFALQKGRFSVFVSFFPQPTAVLPVGGGSGASCSFWSGSLAASSSARWSACRRRRRDAAPIVGPSVFLSPPFLWFYIYFGAGIAAFYFFWAWYSPHPWQNWSILGSSLILFATNFSVQVSIALNNWRGLFYDMVQRALATPGAVDASRPLYRRRPVSGACAGGYNGRSA